MVVVAMERDVQCQVGMEVEQEVGCDCGVPGDLGLKPHDLPTPV